MNLTHSKQLLPMMITVLSLVAHDEIDECRAACVNECNNEQSLVLPGNIGHREKFSVAGGAEYE